MILIGKSKIIASGSADPPGRKPLAAWEQVMKHTVYSSFINLKKNFKVLMEEHSLGQSDLSEIGSQSLISKILIGERQLTIPHVE
jgi:hypothetical protein